MATSIFQRLFDASESAEGNKAAKTKNDYLVEIVGSVDGVKGVDSQLSTYENTIYDGKTKLEIAVVRSERRQEKTGQTRSASKRKNILAKQSIDVLNTSASSLLDVEESLSLINQTLERDKRLSWMGWFSFIMGANIPDPNTNRKVQRLRRQLETELLYITDALIANLAKYRAGEEVEIKEGEDELSEDEYYRTIVLLRRLTPYFHELESRNNPEPSPQVRNPQHYQHHNVYKFELSQRLKALTFSSRLLNDTSGNFYSVFLGRRVRARLPYLELMNAHALERAKTASCFADKYRFRESAFERAISQLDLYEKQLNRLFHGKALAAVKATRARLISEKLRIEGEEISEAQKELKYWLERLAQRGQNIEENTAWISKLPKELQEDVVKIRDYFANPSLMDSDDFLNLLRGVLVGQGIDILQLCPMMEAVVVNRISPQVRSITHPAYPLVYQYHRSYAYTLHNPQRSDVIGFLAKEEAWQADEKSARAHLAFLLGVEKGDEPNFRHGVNFLTVEVLTEHLLKKPLSRKVLSRIMQLNNDVEEGSLQDYCLKRIAECDTEKPALDFIVTEMLREPTQENINALYIAFHFLVENALTTLSGEDKALVIQALRTLSTKLERLFCTKPHPFPSNAVKDMLSTLAGSDFIDGRIKEALRGALNEWEAPDYEWQAMVPEALGERVTDEDIRLDSSIAMQELYSEFQASLTRLQTSLREAASDLARRAQVDFTNFQFNRANLTQLIGYSTRHINEARSTRMCGMFDRIIKTTGINKSLEQKLAILIKIFTHELSAAEKQEAMELYFRQQSVINMTALRERRQDTRTLDAATVVHVAHALSQP